jgi:stringent starvation protein B
MGIATGTVVGGKVQVDGVTLPEGAVVTILTREHGAGFTLSIEEENDLLESIAEADRGETISAEELFVRLDRAAKQ